MYVYIYTYVDIHLFVYELIFIFPCRIIFVAENVDI